MENKPLTETEIAALSVRTWKTRLTGTGSYRYNFVERRWLRKWTLPQIAELYRFCRPVDHLTHNAAAFATAERNLALDAARKGGR